jgi:hypothetical protein
MASTDVPIALLGYGTVGSAVDRLLRENGEDIERATGHRIRVVRALVRDPDTERPSPPDAGVLTTDFSSIRDDPEIAVERAVANLPFGDEPGLEAMVPPEHVRGRRKGHDFHVLSLVVGRTASAQRARRRAVHIDV